jgi:hypothetical protein
VPFGADPATDVKQPKNRSGALVIVMTFHPSEVNEPALPVAALSAAEAPGQRAEHATRGATRS